MIPLKDDAPSSTTPYVNFTLIGLNVAVFLCEAWIWSQNPGNLNAFVQQYGLVPERLNDELFHVGFFQWLVNAIVPVFSSMFLHGSVFHLIFNMWGLWIFGDAIEDHLGHGMYLVFYIVCGVAAAFLHIVADADSLVPMIGASGAIAGVLGAYLRLFPRQRVLIWWPNIFAASWFQWVSAWIVLGWWIVGQVLAALEAFRRGGSAGGVAVWAHLGGFLAGMLFIEFLPARRRYHIEF